MREIENVELARLLAKAQRAEKQAAWCMKESIKVAALLREAHLEVAELKELVEMLAAKPEASTPPPARRSPGSKATSRT